MSCEVCGDCGCEPGTVDIGVGEQQIEPCRCPGCWEARQGQLEAERRYYDSLTAGEF